MQWLLLPFDRLTNIQLYKILQLRNQVFIVEQACSYDDIDGLDTNVDCHHLLGMETDQLVAYSRLLAPGCGYHNHSSIGRVLVAPSHRQNKVGHQLMEVSIENCQRLWPGHDIKLSAQSHLQLFYRTHQFLPVSSSYLEDGIPHIDMVRSR